MALSFLGSNLEEASRMTLLCCMVKDETKYGHKTKRETLAEVLPF